MEFFNSAIEVLQTLVVALGAGLGVWGAINLLEGYGNDNPGSNAHVRQRSKQPKTRDRPPAPHYSEPKKTKTKRQALWKCA